MQIIKDNMIRYLAICPKCKSELEVTEADQLHNSFTYRKELMCPCCGKADAWDRFVLRK